MAIIQFSIPSDVLRELLDRGDTLGLSEHQVAKWIMLLAKENVADSDIMVASRQRQQKRRGHGIL